MKRGVAVEIPLGVSEAYDRLPSGSDEMPVHCQDCDRFFTDRWRRSNEGSRVLAVFCPDCRSRRRMRYAASLPQARVLPWGT